MIYGMVWIYVRRFVDADVPKCISFEPTAEETCESLLKTAFETDPDNTEALIQLASLRLSQQREEEAKEAALKAWRAMEGLDAGQCLLRCNHLSRLICVFLVHHRQKMHACHPFLRK